MYPDIRMSVYGIHVFRPAPTFPSGIRYELSASLNHSGIVFLAGTGMPESPYDLFAANLINFKYLPICIEEL